MTYSQNLGEVCTDYSRSLQKVLRTYKFKYAYSLQRVRCTHFGKCAHSQKPVSELYKQLIGKEVGEPHQNSGVL